MLVSQAGSYIKRVAVSNDIQGRLILRLFANLSYFVHLRAGIQSLSRIVV
jgi:hypothetical protein